MSISPCLVCSVKIRKELHVTKIRCDEAVVTTKVAAKHIRQSPRVRMHGNRIERVVRDHHGAPSSSDKRTPRPKVDVIEGVERDVGGTAVRVAVAVRHVVLGFCNNLRRV